LPGLKRKRRRASAINEALKKLDLSVRFRIEREEGIVRILVVERQSGEVIKTIPPERFMQATEALSAAFMKGLIIGENA